MFLAGEATKLARTYLITGVYLWFQYNQSRQLSPEEIDRGRAGVLGTMAALILQEAYFAHHIRKTVEKEHLSIVNTEQVNFGRRVVGRLMCSSSAQQSLPVATTRDHKNSPPTSNTAAVVILNPLHGAGIEISETPTAGFK
jgi:hypothetical protein